MFSFSIFFFNLERLLALGSSQTWGRELPGTAREAQKRWGKGEKCPHFLEGHNGYFHFPFFGPEHFKDARFPQTYTVMKKVPLSKHLPLEE